MTGNLVPHAVTATIFWGMLLAAAVSHPYRPSVEGSGWTAQSAAWERARTKLTRGGRLTKTGIDGDSGSRAANGPSTLE
jgi:hypothetical protein